MRSLILRLPLAVLALTAAAAYARATQYERPPTYTPQQALGAAAKGPNYEVLSPVASDGFLRSYKFKSPDGVFEVRGDQLMRARIRELSALNALQETSGAHKFGEAAVQAGLSPVVFAGSLVVHPIDTTKNTISGVGQFFNGVAAGVNNFGKSQDSALASMTGATKQKRLIAAQFGVDPYTDFEPLAARLESLSGAAAAGNLAVSGAFVAIPGAAGIVISNTSTASTLNGMIKDYSAAQLMDMNRAKLSNVGVGGAAVDALLANLFYTPVDVTAIADALSRIGGATNTNAVVAAAAEADSRDKAYFIRRSFELAAARLERAGSVSAFALSGDRRFSVCVMADGAAVGVFAIDSLAWTPATAKILAALTTAVKRNGAADRKTLVISGVATALAKHKLAELGWGLEQKAQ